MKGKHIMARANRVVVEDGRYHLTTRIANQAHFLEDPAVKDLIVTWIYGIADFAGIEVLNWNILDNHLHIQVHVPCVPEKLMLPGADPTPSAFTMRPAECRQPRWTPDVTDVPVPVTAAGECPSAEAVARAIADGVPVVRLPRPATGFSLDDDEMERRLVGLYGAKRAKSIVRRWQRLLARGCAEKVEEEKDAFCRRMYNVSLFMKDLKQRISQHFNEKRGHRGCLWDGRFYSGLVENEPLAKLYTTAYIDWNAPKAGLAEHPSGWKWCSYAVACGDGPYAERARRGYELALGCPWPEAKAKLERVFADRIPDSYDPTKDQTHYTVVDSDGTVRTVALRMAQAIKLSLRAFRSGGFVSRRVAFVRETYAKLPKRFPGAGERSVAQLSEFDWELADPAA